MDAFEDLYRRAQQSIPGGVTAAARINRYLGRPFFASRGEGSKIYDLEGRPYVDMNTSNGAALLGHRHPSICQALAKAAEIGIVCATEFEQQTLLAEKLIETVPCMEMVRFTLSGTETTSYAVRLAHVYTGRRKVVKIEGHFHGFNEYLQYNCWPSSGDGLPAVKAESGGFPEQLQDSVIVLPFNDIEAVERTIHAEADQIAALILEPLNYNAGCIEPLEGYLQRLRKLTADHGIVLIFDEILSGFRTGPDCIQGYYGVTPDLCTIGKPIGGGLPLSAFGGKREIMQQVAPLGKMMHTGTYHAHLVNILCGNVFMDVIMKPGAYGRTLRLSERLYEGLNRAFRNAGLKAAVRGVGCRFGLLFGTAAEKKPQSYHDVSGQNWDIGYRLFRETLKRGVYFHSAWHHGLSLVHSDSDVDQVIEVVEEAAKIVAAQPRHENR
jgi:glutamate-1-semialdehyde 2,1-aminomutase